VKSLPGQLNRRVALALLVFIPVLLCSQNKETPVLPRPTPDSIKYDTIHIPGGVLIFAPDFFFQVPKDTFMLVKSYSFSKGEMRSQASTKTFYDSAYVKFGRHKISKFLYTLFFVQPKVVTLPDTVQILRSEVPYVKYKGKIIRHIRVKTFDPFGPTIADTCGQASTWLGKSGNKTHLTTRNFVIRKNLFFKQGQPVDPILLADNERFLREMPAIDDVNIILSPADPAGDSVDITVITKDVFSIGFNFLEVTPGKSVFQLYDGNFLGLGDRLVNEFSIDKHRGPYFREEGINYYLTNISGTFIDGIASYYHDDAGNQRVGFQLRRSFFSNRTRWAGSGLYQYSRYKDEVNDYLKITSYYYDANLWIGRAFFLKNEKEPVRLIISEAAYNRHYYSRPYISADSNKRYYNFFQLFSGFSISKNNYYLTDFVFELGKREHIPYGHLFQLTFGPEFSDYSVRFYSGIEVAMGDFIKKFGYLSGEFSFSGFFRGNSYEDAILKIQTRYMTYLFFTPSRRYKFRIYVITEYRTGFNFRLNNRDYTNINQYLQLNKTTDENSLRGLGSLAANLSAVVYTPWFFYGFKFALLEQIQGGFVAKKNTALFATAFYPGIRTGLIIKNDNLIFPALVISLFYYPNTPSGGSMLQFLMNISTGIQFSDYNVSAPKEETLQN
jgi:hypothetical protein